MKTTLWAPHEMHNCGIDTYTYRRPRKPQLKCGVDCVIHLSHNARQQRHWGGLSLSLRTAWGAPQPASVYERALCMHTLSQGCAFVMSPSPNKSLKPVCQSLLSLCRYFTSQNRQRMDNTRHSKWSFPILTSLAFPAARSF